MELSRNWHWMWSTFYFHNKYHGFIFAIKVSSKFLSALFKVVFYMILFNKRKVKFIFKGFLVYLIPLLVKNRGIDQNILTH